MAIIDWPQQPWAVPSAFAWALQTQQAAWSAVYTGQTQRITHLADRWRVTMALPPCTGAEARQQGAQREAYLARLARSGDWVRMWHMARPEPLGSMRGSPTAGAAAAGATTLAVQSTAGATLLAGDMLGVAGQLVQVAYGGAVADGSGLAVVPLVMPLRLPVTNGAAVVWNRPVATFQFIGTEYGARYGLGMVQEGADVQLLEVF